ncbi:Trypsin [Beauveria bassiana]|uniref:Trypsin n=1 Tax=Beauveria bassiana TaxID=176275 RepID=A0A2N6NW08_BEABA|nr:Trypsin [Beauveria bassiana]
MVRKASITLVVAFSAALAAAAAINKRIRGGEEAQEGEFPFVVRLHYENPIVLCAGSLLDSTTVLTAAHCLEGKGDGVLSVRAGSLSKDYGGVVAEVESVRKHPDWTQIDHQNDIAILKLSSPIEESETIGYAKLPPGGSNPVNGSTAMAAGW